jgi:hypothetical protein
MPVGFGDHHWELTDSAGRRWFVTVAGLSGPERGTGPAVGYADLRAAMDTVTALAGAGLEFAVAPVPTTDGQSLARSVPSMPSPCSRIWTGLAGTLPPRCPRRTCLR